MIEFFVVMWIVCVTVWAAIFVDSRRSTPFLPPETHRPLLWAIGGALTAGAGWLLFATRSTPPKSPQIQPPVVVLRGGSEDEAEKRTDEARDLVARTEAHDEKHDAAILDAGDDVPDDLVERLRDLLRLK